MMSTFAPSRRLAGVESAQRSKVIDDVPTSLLSRISQGDQGAVQECIDRYGGLVWSLARRFLANQSEAEDAVQEIFIDVWKSAGRFDENVASEATFSAMMARRRLIDRGRRKRHTPDIDAVLRHADERPEAPLDTAEVSEDAGRAVEALKQLRPDQQRVLRLSVFHGLSHEKIAEATGLPLGTVKTHVRRGLIKVREILAEQGDAGEEDTLSPGRLEQ